MKKVFRFFREFFNECQDKNLILLAASSSFFFFLCLIPLSLLLLSFVGFVFETVTPKDTFSFLNYIDSMIPKDIMPTFRALFKHSTDMIQANKELNTIHYIILAASSIGFFGSIWRSVEIITGSKKRGTVLHTLKSFMIIALSFAFILCLIAIPLILRFANYITKHEYLQKLNFEKLSFDLQDLEYSGINISSALVLFLFFIFFFKVLLHGKATIKATMVGSAVFTFSVALTKFFFFSYLLLVKSNLMNNYGSLYSFMIFVLWIYVVILLFYMAIIFTYILSNQRFEILSNNETPPEFLTK